MPHPIKYFGLSLLNYEWCQKHCQYHEQLKWVNAHRSYQDGILIDELKTFLVSVKLKIGLAIGFPNNCQQIGNKDTRLDLKIFCLPSLNWPNSVGGDSKYFIGLLKAKKIFSKVADYFNVKFYFLNACLNSVEHMLFLSTKN